METTYGVAVYPNPDPYIRGLGLGAAHKLRRLNERLDHQAVVVVKDPRCETGDHVFWAWVPVDEHGDFIDRPFDCRCNLS